MNRLLQAPLSAFLLLACAYTASAHGGEHSQVVVAPDADWPTRHMAGKHHRPDPTTNVANEQ
jgi:hypothetical protein